MTIYDYNGPRIMMKIMMKFSIDDRSQKQLNCNKSWFAPISKNVQAGFIASFNDDKGVNAVIDSLTKLMNEYMHAKGQKKCPGFGGWAKRSNQLKNRIKNMSV